MTESFSGVPESGGIHSGSEGGCRRIFLEGNLTVSELCAGDEVRNLRTLSSLFGVEISARENIISFRGDEVQQGRISGFFTDLSALYKLRKSPITQRDFDFLCGSTTQKNNNRINHIIFSFIIFIFFRKAHCVSAGSTTRDNGYFVYRVAMFTKTG